MADMLDRHLAPSRTVNRSILIGRVMRLCLKVSELRRMHGAGLLLSGTTRLFSSCGTEINDLFSSRDIQNNMQLITT